MSNRSHLLFILFIFLQVKMISDPKFLVIPLALLLMLIVHTSESLKKEDCEGKLHEEVKNKNVLSN